MLEDNSTADVKYEDMYCSFGVDACGSPTKKQHIPAATAAAQAALQREAAFRRQQEEVADGGGDDGKPAGDGAVDGGDDPQLLQRSTSIISKST